MRFVSAIIAFVIATVLIGVGVAQRTILLPPGSVSAVASQPVAEPYVFIDSATLKSHPDAQTINLSGQGPMFFAYGRTADVQAWLNGSSYSQLGLDKETGELTATVVPADASGAANVAGGSSNPAGSDLWLQEYSGEGSLDRTINVPDGYSVIIASDGTQAAPSSIKLSWPVDNSTPFAVPLLLAGSVVLLIGLAFLIWGLVHMKKQQGPRRKPPAIEGGSKRKAIGARKNAGGKNEGGKNEGGMKNPLSITKSIAVVPALLLALFASAGVANAQPVATAVGAAPVATAPVATAPVATAPVATAPVATAPVVAAPSTTDPTNLTTTPAPTTAPEETTSPTPTPTPTSTPMSASEVVPPAVTEAQAKAIIAQVTTVAAEGDAAGDATLLESRFTGPALELRKATYAIRAGYPEFPAPVAIPDGNISVILPQATNVWPKTVFAIAESQDKSVALSLTMVQQTARANYKVAYAISLEPDTTLPPVAAATVGTSRLAPDSKLLSMTPQEVASAYSDILLNGANSQFYSQIDTTNDSLVAGLGLADKDRRRAEIPATATIEFGKNDIPIDQIALSTTSSGALVTLTIGETETVRPAESGVTVKTQGAVKALSGIEETATGVQATFNYQLLFYIPASGDSAKPTLLGFSQGLVQAKEIS